MKLTNEMNFPYPVLAEWRDDFNTGNFSVEVSFQEDKEKNQLVLHFETVLECEDIERMLQDGSAQAGCFVTCISTGYRRLLEIGRPTYLYKFKPGDLLDAVVIRPIVWATKPVKEWAPSDVHPEFFGGHNIDRGNVLAMAEEGAIQVGKADLPSLETIFQLKFDETLDEGEFSVDMDADKITILAARQTYDLVETLRASGPNTAAVVMNAVFVPVVMRVLGQVATQDGSGNFAEFESRRWVTAFQRRCDKLEIRHVEDQSLGNAQKLLEYPFSSLANVTGE